MINLSIDQRAIKIFRDFKTNLRERILKRLSKMFKIYNKDISIKYH